MKTYDILIVGAGFAGLYMLHRCRQMGFRVLVLEAGGGVGGTWYWNRYPGARCDVESMSYSYSFSEELQQEWEWGHRYATQPEILRYANHVADRFDLRKDICLNTRVTAATYKAQTADWTVSASDRAKRSARFLIMATGCLSVPKSPDLPRLDAYEGTILHTARWPEDGVDFSGRSVGLIGTGSSGIQSIPLIARQARHLTVLQRTPNFSIPAWNAPLSPERMREMRAHYKELRRKSRASYAGDYADEGYLSILDLSPEEREEQFEKRWREGGFNFQYAFADVMVSEEANALAAEFARNKIRYIVKNPETAERLCPKDHPIGSKRLCVDTDYYETYNRDNVELVDLREEPITGFMADGLRTVRTDYRFDTLVLATGFDAMTGALSAIDIRGRNGKNLKEAWRDGPATYLGLAVAGFPNLFIITGPGSPSVFANMVLAIEQHVEWLSELLGHTQTQGISVIEAEQTAQDAWVQHVAEGANKTLFPRANSWYLGANVPGKPRVFMPFAEGFCVYEKICDEIAADGYRGFRFTRTRAAA